MPSIFTLRSSTLRSGADLRADILALTQSPATVTVTPVALGISAAISLALSPATITVTGIAGGITPGTASPALSPATVTVTSVAQGITPGGVSLAQSPATITVTPVASDVTPGAVSAALSPATVTTTAQTFGITAPAPASDATGGGGKWGITRQDREALDRHREGEEHQRMLVRDDEELFAVI